MVPPPEARVGVDVAQRAHALQPGAPGAGEELGAVQLVAYGPRGIVATNGAQGVVTDAVRASQERILRVG